MESQKNLFQIRSLDGNDRQDISLAVAFMRTLGEYQKMLDHTTVTEEQMKKLLVSQSGAALVGEIAGKPVSFIYYYPNSSAFIGKKGFYIDALYVDEKYRGAGIGKKMIAYMADLALRNGCERLEWGCLDWNTPAIRFYENLGAKGVDIMTIYRMNKDELSEMLK